jgi:hypothetical protein
MGSRPFDGTGPPQAATALMSERPRSRPAPIWRRPAAPLALSDKLSLSGDGIDDHVCIGFSASSSGRIAVKVDATNYKELSGNTLTGRTVWFDRRLSSSSTWTPNVHSVIATSASGSNWTRAISNPGSGNGTWNYRMHMDTEDGLAASNTAAFSITWTNSPTVC